MPKDHNNSHHHIQRGAHSSEWFGFQVTFKVSPTIGCCEKQTKLRKSALPSYNAWHGVIETGEAYIIIWFLIGSDYFKWSHSRMPQCTFPLYWLLHLPCATSKYHIQYLDKVFIPAYFNKVYKRNKKVLLWLACSYFCFMVLHQIQSLSKAPEHPSWAIHFPAQCKLDHQASLCRAILFAQTRTV